MNIQTENATAATATVSLPVKTRITLQVNGATEQLEVAPWTVLLDALRECWA